MRSHLALAFLSLAVPAAAQTGVAPSSAAVQASTAAVTASTGTVAASTAIPAGLPGLAPEPAREAAPPGPWYVGEVVVRGNEHVKTKVVRAQVRAREGDLYTRNDVNRDIENIMGLGSFEKATAEAVSIATRAVPAEFLKTVGSTMAVRLSYEVSEKPLIAAIKYKGYKAIGKGTLSDELGVKANDPYDAFKLKEGTAKILVKYHEKGYIDAKVDTRVTPRAGRKNEVDIEVRLTEGPRAMVKDVVVEGVTAFKKKKIVKQMSLRPKKVFDPKKLEEDFKEIEKFYKGRGYPDYELQESTYSFSPDRTGVTIMLKISEGRQARFGATAFSGNEVYTAKELRKAVTYRAGKLFDTEKFDETIALIQDKYAEKGRLRTKVEPVKTVNAKTGFTDIEFKITEGNVVYVDHVDVEGNTATKTYVLKRELTQKEGQVFSSVKVRKSQEKLFNLGFIEDVQVDIQSPSDPDHVDLVFAVTEGKPGMLTAGVGYSSIGGLIGTLSVSHMNLFGRAQRLSLVWQFGKRVQDYSVNWSTRWLGESPTSLSISVFDTNHIKPFSSTFSAFNDRRTGGSVRLGPRFEDDKYQVSFGYGYQKVRVSNISEGLKTQLTPGTSVISTVSAEFARDTRDNVFFPNQGNYNSIGVDLAGVGGDVYYYKPGLASNWWQPLWSFGDYTHVLAFTNRGGWIRPWHGQKDTPVYDRFFLGGPDTVRGYNVTGQVGPRSGGNVYYVGNLEYQFPMVREHRRTFIQGAFFTDLGGAWDQAADMSARIGSRSHDLKSSVGFGIRFTTPAFPIRLDYGYGLNHHRGEQRWQIHFAIGNIAF